VTGYTINQADHKSTRDVAIDFFEHGTVSEKKDVSPLVSTIRRGFTSLESENTARIMGSGDYAGFSTCYSMGTWEKPLPRGHFQENVGNVL
jgi:deacetoxycephalosporin-C synthase